MVEDETDTIGNGLTVKEFVVEVHAVVPSVKVKSTIPSVTRVTTPPDVIVATEASLLTQVPPDVGEIVTEPSTQTAVLEIETVGFAFTVKDAVVAEQVVAASVKVKSTIPSATKVTMPPTVTVATEVLLLIQDPPVVGVKITEPF
jgi:hypothetical protein